jgi:periplasmic divalent cation tolerance protein
MRGPGGSAGRDLVSEFVVVLCTAPSGGAAGIARALVEERLAACVNVSTVRSYFVWEGKLAEEGEELMIIKSEKQMVESLTKRIKELHSYRVPEIIVLSISEGDEAYLRWLDESVG